MWTGARPTTTCLARPSSPRCATARCSSTCPAASSSTTRRCAALRLAHLHRNVPGVLAKINGLLAEHKVNVEAQLLGTSGEIGYVVTDSASGVTQEIVDTIRAMPETLRLRVLF